jgi:hypothetical protein
MAENPTEKIGGITWSLLNLSVGRASLAGIVLADTIGTGSLAIFLYWPTLYLTLDVSKLLLLSFAITAPFISFGAFMMQLTATSNRTGTGALHDGLGPRLATSTACHCLTSLLAMGLGGLWKFLGSVSLEPVAVFWAYSALYAYAMAILSFHKPGRSMSTTVKLSLPIVVWPGFLVIAPVGRHLGWWH